jgi:hypothetical protein
VPFGAACNVLNGFIIELRVLIPIQAETGRRIHKFKKISLYNRL